MLKIALAIIASCTLVLSLISAFFAGIFDSVHLSEKVDGPYNMVYRARTGSYSAVSFMTNDVYKYVKTKKKIAPSKLFSVYYDNPEKTTADSLRSIAGVIVDSAISVEDPYKYGTMQKIECIVSTFPNRSMFSHMSGMYKFYQAIEKLSVEKKKQIKGPVVEIYQPKSKYLTFIAPLNQDKIPADSSK